MNRDAMRAAAEDGTHDVLVIGGGATGLGLAVDAASRGWRTVLLEAEDLAKGTSSRSTKLVHGGVRYLEQLDFSLVMEALRERGLMARNAPHLVHHLRFVVPRYSWWEGPFYGVGLKLYDALAGKLNLAPSRSLGREQTVAAIPNVHLDGLLGGTEYHDGQFDDARMAVALARTAVEHGAALVTRCRVTGLLREAGRVVGAEFVDQLTGRSGRVRARVTMNATGIWSDEVRRMEDPAAPAMVEPAQGVHLVLPASFAPGGNAIMVPHTDDGRVLFVIPWHGRVLVGTTDTPMPRAELEPRPLPEEVEFILRNAARYLERQPTRADVLSAFAGQRPLVHPGGTSGTTKSVSRRHEVVTSAGGLVSVMGGKWTIYRKMAEDGLAHAAEVGGLEPRPCVTESLRLHGWSDSPVQGWGGVFGAEAAEVERFLRQTKGWEAPMHPRLELPLGLAAWAARNEMALGVEDVLARRTRALLLDARAAMEAAEPVARVLAAELGRDGAWVADEVARFAALARGYLP
ncbi:MAG: glycerol-3-phosphate dehydrogenase/oxidase [Phycisphaerales bacterium]